MKLKTFTVGWKNHLVAQYPTKCNAWKCKIITTQLKANNNTL